VFAKKLAIEKAEKKKMRGNIDFFRFLKLKGTDV